MKLLSWGTLREYADRHQSRANYSALVSSLRAWRKVVEDAKWKSFNDVRRVYRSADLVGDRIVFDICGNNFRIVARVDYEFGLVLVKFIGTHDEYDQIDVTQINIKPARSE